MSLQFYEAETYVPLCTDSQSQIHGLPPSYDTVMASEKRFLEKYGDLFRSKKCCHHMQKATSTVNEQCGDLSVVEVVSSDFSFLHFTKLSCTVQNEKKWFSIFVLFSIVCGAENRFKGWKWMF